MQRLDACTDFKYNAIQTQVIMKQQQSLEVRPTSSLMKREDSDRETELKAINRILDRRYEMLVQLS